jgi:hypothetical protein
MQDSAYQIKTSSGWWFRVDKNASEVRKIHNEIELELRQAEIKPISYADRTNDLGVFHFGDRGFIYVQDDPTKSQLDPTCKVVVTYHTGERGHGLEYYSNKAKIHAILKAGYKRRKK